MFLVVAGLTGSVLVFSEELDRGLNARLYRVEARGRSLSSGEIIEVAERLVPRGEADIVLDLHRAPDGAAIVLINPVTGAAHLLGFDQVFIDPYSGRVLGTRLRSENRLDREHIVPILLRLHDALLLPDPWGVWLLGAVALLWSANCFVGFYLTLPTRARRFLASWKTAWWVRPTRSIPQLSFDIHRAAGLWTWAMLLVLAVSAVQFNLGSEMFTPALKAVLPLHDPWSSIPEPRKALDEPRLSWNQALERGRELMSIHARRAGFEIQHESELFLDQRSNVHVYTVKSSLDVRDRFGETRVLFSASSGRELGFTHPHIASGNALSSWLSALHTARVGGWPMRILICVMGIVTVALSITGVIVWLRRRGPRGSKTVRPLRGGAE